MDTWTDKPKTKCLQSPKVDGGIKITLGVYYDSIHKDHEKRRTNMYIHQIFYHKMIFIKYFLYNAGMQSLYIIFPKPFGCSEGYTSSKGYPDIKDLVTF